MRLASRARILGITSTQETRSEEDGVENRSEPQEWLADGSPGSADPAQDADQPAGVKTASSTAGTQAAEVHADAGQAEAEQAVAYTNGSSAHAGGGSSNGNGSASWDNGGSSSSYETSSPWDNASSASPSGATVPPSWGSPAAEVAPADAEVSAGFGGSGSPTVAAPYTAPQAPYAAPQAPAGFPAAPAPSRPSRPGKARRPQGGSTVPSSGAGGAQAAGGASTRKAQLTVSRIEPWSVMKFSFMISLVGWVILFVAVAIMYFVLSKLGVFHSVENTVGLVTASKAHTGTNAASWFAASRVLGYTMLVGAVNVILITALATVGAVLYNLVTMLAGGIEVTLKETD
jgi:transmembrane protein DUF3566